MSPPPTCRLKPRSHKMTSTTRTVQSIFNLPNTEPRGCKWGSHPRAGFLLQAMGSLGYWFPSTTACDFAEWISARNAWVAAGAGTLPNSNARVVIPCPYMARRESLS